MGSNIFLRPFVTDDQLDGYLTPEGVIMPMGTLGAGVGICPEVSLPTGYIGMPGYRERASENFGNYITPYGSIRVFIPKFYYLMGTGTNGLPVNVPDIKGINTYPTTALANAAGYALHRMFIDGGAEKSGVFVDKFMASVGAYGGNNIAISVKNGLPISFDAAHNPASGLTGITVNQYYSAIDACRLLPDDSFCTSKFIYSGLAMISLAHANAASGAGLACGWYSATTNFPKGCNNNALSDTDDTTIKFASDGYSNCAKTGSGIPFSKTTHNGQECGICDLNGLMYEVSIGVTCIAATKTISGVSLANPCVLTLNNTTDLVTGGYCMITAIVGTTQLNDKIYKYTVIDATTISLTGVDSSGFTAYGSAGTLTFGTFYVAKEATSMKNFTSGATLATDHWGATGVAAMMQAITPVFRSDYPNNGFALRMGSGANQVLSEATAGDAWLRTALGMPMAEGAVDVTGTNAFGKDYFYQYIINSLCLLSCAAWSSSSTAGVWHSSWRDSRASSGNVVGFRAACYPVN